MAEPIYFAKRLLRITDSLIAQRHRMVAFRGKKLYFLSTYWWNTASQQIFDDEIVPYFAALGDFRPAHILDVGAAEGQFAIAAASIFTECSVCAFEPAQRQRILLARNARLNRIANITIEPFGLWKEAAALPFRTQGAESSFAPVSRFKGKLKFPEIVEVLALDQWVEAKGLEKIDLIKMDVEGAEIEILQGARTTLATYRPRLLIQAYHLRDTVRTYERCAQILRQIGYDVDECPGGSGLLYAR